MKKNRKLKLFYYSIRITMVLLLSTSILGIFIDSNDADISRNIFVAIQLAILLILSFGPSFVEKKFKLDIPNYMKSVFLIFILAALLMGEVVNFFVTVSWWDDMLHITSTVLVSIVGFSVINSVARNPDKKLVLKPFIIALFVFCFSMTVEVIWELFEYTLDNLSSSSNMLRTVNSVTLVPYNGLTAIKDTMYDLILNAISSLVISIAGYFDAKNNFDLFSKWLICPKVETQK